MKHLQFAFQMPGLEALALEGGVDSIDAAKDMHAKMTGKKKPGTSDVKQANATAARMKTIILKMKSHVSASNVTVTKPINVGPLVKLVGADKAKTAAQLIEHIKAYNGNVGHVIEHIAKVGEELKGGMTSAEKAEKVASEDQHKLLDHNHAGPHPAVKMVFTKQELLHLLDVAANACDRVNGYQGLVTHTGEQALQPATEGFFESVGRIFLWVFKIVFKIFLIYLWICVYIARLMLILPTLGLSLVVGAYVMSWINTIYSGIDMSDHDVLWTGHDKDDDYDY